MTNETAKELTVVKSDAPIEWRSRDQVDALAKRFRIMMPGKLTREQALALAQYSAALDANPFRGEVYAFDDGRGGMALTEGYKLLVRWARRQCQFYDRYEPLRDELAEGDIGFKCYILREDAKGILQMLVDAGADWKDAFAIAAQSAVGVVTQNDRTTRQGKPIPPPKGWTWEAVARKRALKNTLNLAYGAPSPREIARESWTVDDIETTPEDWPDDAGMLSIERELTARANAMNRQRQPSDVDAAAAFNDLFDDELPAQESNDGEATQSFDPDNPVFANYDDLYHLAVEHLGFNHPQHAKNALKKATNGDKDELTHQVAWQLLKDYQAAKASDNDD